MKIKDDLLLAKKQITDQQNRIHDLESKLRAMT